MDPGSAPLRGLSGMTGIMAGKDVDGRDKPDHDDGRWRRQALPHIVAPICQGTNSASP